jgi:predicted RecB family endonuclease
MIMESLTAELDEAKAALSQRDKEVVELKSSVEELSRLLEGESNKQVEEKLQSENAALRAEIQTLKSKLVEASEKKTAEVAKTESGGETLQEKLARMKASAAAASSETPAEKLARLKAESAAPPAGETPAEKLARLKASIQK